MKKLQKIHGVQCNKVKAQRNLLLTLEFRGNRIIGLSLHGGHGTIKSDSLFFIVSRHPSTKIARSESLLCRKFNAVRRPQS
ncbi:MAG: hypothetical protein WA957_08235 [Alteraurantiacibacter sp.]